MQQVAEWLEKLGMSEYARRFAENGIDFGVLFLRYSIKLSCDVLTASIAALSSRAWCARRGRSRRPSGGLARSAASTAHRR
jgi:SAM domain (Sterile alpha motif)